MGKTYQNETGTDVLLSVDIRRQLLRPPSETPDFLNIFYLYYILLLNIFITIEQEMTSQRHLG